MHVSRPAVWSIPLLIAIAMSAAGPNAHADPAPLTGRWIASVDFFGVPQYFTMQIVQTANALSGDFDGDKLTGTVNGTTVEISGKDANGGFEDVKATVANGVITGSVNMAFAGDLAHPATHDFTATLVAPRTSRPRRHDFTPTAYYRQFSAATKPVLTVAAGDTIATTTVDAGGADAKGVRRVLGGNPETGPFYVDGAVPGDTLVVHIVRLRLDRDWALSDDGLVPRALDSELAVKAKDIGKGVRWHLDVARGVATSEASNEHLANYAVPLRPMLGCVAVAPRPAQAAPGTGDSGPWGGNMDFNEIVEGSTVYLPVYNPGALLYIGDAHAAQGDGELTGDALETSMDVQITVDVISGTSVPSPRVETPTHLIAMAWKARSTTRSRARPRTWRRGWPSATS